MSSNEPSTQLIDLVRGFRISQALYVVSALGIGDLLGEKSRTSEELAKATGAHARNLYRVMRTLAAAGVFREDSGQLFSLTALGRSLRTDVPGSVADFGILVGRTYWLAWGALLHAVKTGENAFRHAHGLGMWDYFAEHPADGSLFAHAMTGNTAGVGNAVVSAYDFSGLRSVVDVGGGAGQLLSELLIANSDMCGVLFDQPETVEKSQSLLNVSGVGARCNVVAGDFFAGVPAGHDAYILKQVLHDWDDDACVVILRNCRAAIKPNGRLIVLERMLAKPNEGLEAKSADLGMLVLCDGAERTEDEFFALFAKSGFSLSRVVPVDARLYLFEGVPS